MRGLDRLLHPESIAIAGLSSDPAKHGHRVLGHLRRLGYSGKVVGINPRLPDVDGVEVHASLLDLAEPPDLVVCAVPGPAVVEIAAQAEGAGALVVFSGGFAETGPGGRELEEKLTAEARGSGVRILGPNSGGVIRPAIGLAASFLTCLDRPAGEIRPGPVGLVTQSGGTGSYLHNLAAGRGGGLAVSVSTGNEADVRLGEAMAAVVALDDVAAILAVVEAVRDGRVFVESVESAQRAGKPVVVCRIGTGATGRRLMESHTGAMAVPEAVLEGVLDSLGVVVAETPAEGLDAAEMMARAGTVSGDRSAVVTHSGGVAILLADLAERNRVSLPQPSSDLVSRLHPLLDHGAPNNPLDMGGIIGGPARFAQVVEAFADSGEYDRVLAVSTPHPPEHTRGRVESLSEMQVPVPVLHLWMAGDQAAQGLESLRRAGLPVTEEPRAAIKALAGLARLATSGPRPPILEGGPEQWGLPLIEGRTVASGPEAVAAAEAIGYPVVLKLVSPGLAHKTEVGGVRLDLIDADQVRAAFTQLIEAAAAHGLEPSGVRVEPFRPGIEVLVGGTVDPSFGPVVSVGLGGILTEVLGDVVFAPAPVSAAEAGRMIDRLRGRALLDEFRGRPASDVAALARIVSLLSRGLVGSGLRAVEINPLVWDGGQWVAVDLLVEE